MNWEKSSVMTEFLKIADDQNLLGLKKIAQPEKKSTSRGFKNYRRKTPKVS